MGPGHQWDTLDNIIGNSNWKKFISFGECISLLLFLDSSEHWVFTYRGISSPQSKRSCCWAKWTSRWPTWIRTVSIYPLHNPAHPMEKGDRRMGEWHVQTKSLWNQVQVFIPSLLYHVSIDSKIWFQLSCKWVFICNSPMMKPRRLARCLHHLSMLISHQASLSVQMLN